MVSSPRNVNVRVSRVTSVSHPMEGSTLRREILSQPDCVARLLENESARIQKLGQFIAKRKPPFALIAARGTSDNAARYAQYAFGYSSGLTVALAAPSLTSVYRRPTGTRGALVIGISQSGQSPDIVETVVQARRGGAFTVAIVNNLRSPLAAAAHEVLPLHAGLEESIAATKTYTTQLTAVALLAAAMARNKEQWRDLNGLPAKIRRALATEEKARESASILQKSDKAVVIGRGFHYATAHEIALKLKELAMVQAEPFSSADFQHGPIAMAVEDLLAILIAPQGVAPAQEMRKLTTILKARGVRILTLGGGRNAIAIPRLPEWISPIAAVVPGQWLAYYGALARGLDPDQPRGIQKVTETR